MNAPSKLLYPMLLVAAFSVTAFSMVGIATITGKMPGAHAEVLDAAPPVVPRSAAHERVRDEEAERHAAPNARSTTKTSTKLAQATPAAAAAVACPACGTVESIRSVERKGSGTGIGAVAGGVGGALIGSQIGGGNGRTAMAVLGGVGGAFAGNEIEKNVRKTTAWQVKVRMEDGTLRLRTLGQQPDLAVGDKVRVDAEGITRRI